VPPELVMPRRAIALLLAALGVLSLLWDRREHVSDVLLPLGIGALLIGAVGGAMWLGGSARVSMHWFGLAALGLAVAGWPLWRRHRGGLPQE
jgi:drug/metabolite transporter (DMT)-like permease